MECWQVFLPIDINWQHGYCGFLGLFVIFFKYKRDTLKIKDMK